MTSGLSTQHVDCTPTDFIGITLSNEQKRFIILFSCRPKQPRMVAITSPFTINWLLALLVPSQFDKVYLIALKQVLLTLIDHLFSSSAKSRPSPHGNRHDPFLNFRVSATSPPTFTQRHFMLYATWYRTNCQNYRGHEILSSGLTRH